MTIEKDERLVANFHDKIEFCTHKKFKTSIKFNQKALLNSYFDINLDLRKKAKIDLNKRFYSS